MLDDKSEIALRIELEQLYRDNELLELRLESLGNELVASRSEVISLQASLKLEKLTSKQIMARMYLSLRKQIDISTGEIEGQTLYICPERSKNNIRCSLIDRHEKEHISEDGDHWWG